VQPSHFYPPVPEPPDQPLPFRHFLRAVRTNALTIWPKSAYQEPVATRTLFGRTNILLNDPDGIHRVLVGNADNYRRSRASVRILKPITGAGLLLSEGEAWKAQRRTVAPALAPRVMPMLASHVIGAANGLIAKLTALNGQPVDLLATMQALSLDIAGRSMFSIQTETFGESIRRLLTEFAIEHSRPSFLDMVLPQSLPTWGDLKRTRFKRRWMALIDRILAERLQTPPQDRQRDLLDLLRVARDPDTGRSFSPERLRDQVATLLLAGHETTAVTLFWTLYLLCRSPADQKKIREEASNNPLTPDTAYSDLPYTLAVINESLRLFPPAFTIVREAIEQDRIGALSIPAGTVIMIAPWVLHRHHGFWRDPNAFDPARFMPGRSAPIRFSFLPFGSGPRVCVGAQFALTETVLVIASLLKHFSVACDQAAHVMPVGIVTTQPDRPLPATFS
jgi:cytochrome P450